MGLLDRFKNKNKEDETVEIVVSSPKASNRNEIYGAKPIDTGNIKSSISASISNGHKPQGTKVLCISEMMGSSEIDKIDTIIVRHSAGQKSQIRGIVGKYAVRNTQSFVPPFIEIDIFLDPMSFDDTKVQGLKWKRIVYECVDNNETLSAISRFPNSMILTIEERILEQLSFGSLTVDTFFGGGK